MDRYDTTQEQLEFWRRTLSDAPELIQLPTDRTRAAERLYESEKLPLTLSTALTEQLTDLARRQDVTLFLTLLSSWAVLLGRWSNQEDVVVGTRAANLKHLRDEPPTDLFDNTVAVRIRLHDDPTIEQLLRRTSSTIGEACAHGDVSFEQVIDALDVPRVGSHTPVFQVWFGLDEVPAPGLMLAEGPHTPPTARFDLALRLTPHGDGLAGTLEYASDLFDRASIERLAESWEVLLGGMVANARCRMSRLPLLTTAEREQVLYEFNNVAPHQSYELLIHQLFEEQVELKPDSMAVQCGPRSLTYAELNGRANQLARHLRGRGVGPDQLVALCMERSTEMVVGMLGVLKAGGAYLPLDPAYPAERLAYMLEDAAPRILLTQERVRHSVPFAATTEVIEIDGDWSRIAEQDDTNLVPDVLGITSRNLAYVIYTSGSTGVPKGAMNEHRGMVNRIIAQQYFEAFSETDICCQKTSISFVDAVFEIFGPLCTGRPLVIIPATVSVDIAKMAALIARRGVTQLLTVPSLARSMLEDTRIMRDLSSLRIWTLSGEEVRADLLKSLQRNLPACEFIIQYGSSEVSSDAAIYKSKRFEGERVPIGRPLPNVQLYVLDRHGEPVPIGVAGEIHVGGVGVGRGYFERPDLTAARFLQDPLRGHSHGRLYRTGDLGRWRADGMLEYLGRNDAQVKIRGFRIELGEIETQLLCLATVREAVVVAREDVPGEKRLVAYITFREEIRASGHSLPDIDDLRAHLKARLPEYMVPTAFVVMIALPLTPNGKLDRRALPAPELDAYSTRPYEAPRDEIERILAQIWQDLLRVKQVGRQHHFFELGGDSLLIARMIQELRRLGLSAEARSVYATPKLADLARTLKADAPERLTVPPNLIPPDCDAITPQMLPLIALDAEQIERIVRAVPGGAANVQDIYPLAPLQEGILFHHLLNETGADTYVASILLAVSSRERLEEFVAALQSVIDRHDALRTAVLWNQLTRPVQVVYREARLAIDERELDRNRDPTEQIWEWSQGEGGSLDLRQAPLMLLRVAADATRRHWYALLEIHHIVEDDVSLKILISEVVAHLQGRAQELPEPLPYRDHLAALITCSTARDAESFFRAKLGDVEEPTAPFGLSDIHGDGTQIEEAHVQLAATLSQRVRTQARRLGVSAATLFHTGWALVIAQCSGREDVVFGTVLLGRSQSGAATAQIMGLFINTLPLRLRLREATARELVEQTHRELMDLLSQEQASLAVAQRCSGMADRGPLFSAVLNYRHSEPGAGVDWDSAPGLRLLAVHERTNYPITLSVDDLGDGFALTAQTDRRIDPLRIAGYLQSALGSLVDALERAPDTPAVALSILPQEERRQIIESFNATQAAYPHLKMIHEIFEEQVELTPEACAVVSAEESLTYTELNGRANQLAGYLRQQGLQVGENIPIVMSRSSQMVIAQIAVLKCGGVYVPVDPAFPVERQVFMIRDCGARWVISDRRAPAEMAEDSVRWIDYDALAGVISSCSRNNLRTRTDALSPAYVMYTSGSTGLPKGVIVPHRAVVRLVINSGYIQIGPEDCVAHCSNPSFDASTFEVWGALLNGASVLIVPYSVVLDPKRFAAVLSERRVTVLWLTAGLFAQYAQSLSGVFPRLRYLLTGGDIVEPGTLRRVMRASPPGHLLNAYGPTECTTFSTTYEVEAVIEEAKSVPIGRPIANTRIYILDPHLQPVPIAATGEIYVGGDGVALGYLNRPELSADRFRADPFDDHPGARMYKTGDLGRWCSDGNVEFVGRTDAQVKLRGFRVELGEIEAQLLQHPHVREAVVVARENAPGDRRLIAYVVTDSADDPLEGIFRQQLIPQLRDYLKGRLPEFMMPSAWMVLKQLPLTSNGKVDRAALPTPQFRSEEMGDFIAPRTDLERTLAEIWSRVLRSERVGVRDNFFQLGGQSLLATSVMTQISHVLEVDLPLRVLFENPTIEALSQLIVQEIAAEIAMEAT